jgi:hypothetical protein
VSDSEPIAFLKRQSGTTEHANQRRDLAAVVVFDRLELNQILNIYGRMVASGEWRDYALDMGRDSAVFSVFRRASEVPIYRIEKSPRLARRQGAYSIVTATGLILKRGPDLARVLSVFDKGVRLVRGS